MSNISKNILEKIENDQVKPKPKWQFLLMHILLIVVFLACLLVGGAMMGLIFLKINNVDWDLLNRVEANFWEFLPAIWFGLLLLMLLIAKQLFTMMEGGYRIRPVILIGLAVGVSLLLGGAIYFTKAADFLEISLRQNVPFYLQMESDATGRFARPDKGVLPGKVITMPVGQEFSLEDLSGKEWNVMYTTEAQPVRMIKIGQPVMVLGTQLNETTFQADQIRVKPPVFTIIRKIEPDLHDRLIERQQLQNEMRIFQNGTNRLEKLQEVRANQSGDL